MILYSLLKACVKAKAGLRDPLVRLNSYTSSRSPRLLNRILLRTLREFGHEGGFEVDVEIKGVTLFASPRSNNNVRSDIIVLSLSIVREEGSRRDVGVRHSSIETTQPLPRLPARGDRAILDL